jgi:hypothetical protein
MNEERARHDRDEELRYDVPDERLAELREPAFYSYCRGWTCPLCDCLMSGQRDIPNTVNEGCYLDGRCACHREATDAHP